MVLATDRCEPSTLLLLMILPWVITCSRLALPADVVHAAYTHLTGHSETNRGDTCDLERQSVIPGEGALQFTLRRSHSNLCFLPWV